MYIRTRQEALDALAETLQKPERPAQIIDVTVKIMLCLNPEPRQLLCDSQAGLIEGGLEQMSQKRQQMLQEAQMEELVLIVNPEEERKYAAVGRTLDALRLSRVAGEVFPAITAQFEPWEIARAVLATEEGVRLCMLETVRARNTPEAEAVAQAAQKKFTAWLEQARPGWRSKTDALKTACAVACGGAPSATDLFHVLAADDQRALHILDLLEKAPGDVPGVLTPLLEIIQTIRRLEQESGDPTDTRSRKSVV